MSRKCFRTMALLVAILLTASCITVAVHAEPARDWGVYSMAENENGVPIFKTPPTYTYTDRGLHVTPSEGINSYTVQAEQACLLDEGFFMEFELEDMTLDNMLLVHVWDQNGVMIGNLQCGSGWYCIMSVNKRGNDYMMSLRLWETSGSKKGGSEILGTKSVTTPVSDGVGRYTLSVAGGVLRLNGSAVPGSDEALAFLKEKNSNGEVYVGMTLMTTDEGQTLTSMTMTRFGRDEATATIVGTNVIPETTPPSAETTPLEPDSGGSSSDTTMQDPADVTSSTDSTTSADPADPADTARPEQGGSTSSGSTTKPADSSDPAEPTDSHESESGDGEEKETETDEFGNYREPDETETQSTVDRLATVYGEAVSICHSSVGMSGAVCVAIMGAAFVLLRKKC